ncbi:hypothetical protein C7N43_30140 [Sphingobacteriales bacterium UPWRP_1]|nr:hypothetical protein BVG80_18620 [Sphingobacteriales bacterium TSM_CSM]PSJ73236.1 hypothetical protein C7N43_30140 [Sphingobacteriales bacterium UPWRP_1]
MFKYILKRLLLMLPTFFGATFLVFAILNLVPGGPLERAIMQLEARATEGGGGGQVVQKNKLTPEVIEQLRRQYGLDKPFMTRYLIWLGFYPREVKSEIKPLGECFREDLRYVKQDGRTYAIQRWIKLQNEGDKVMAYASGVGSDFKFSEDYAELPDCTAITEWDPAPEWKTIETKPDGSLRIVRMAFSGIFTGDFGRSYIFNRPVLELIWERLYISAYFGIIGFLLSYLVCIPLGIMKAVKHNTPFDFASSALIFAGYATPGYALGVLLLSFFASGRFLKWFPLGGFRSPDWEQLSMMGKILDQLHHTALPVICYMIGAFATLTLLMKNSLLENLSQDYVRTAFAKGLDEKTVIFKHAVRNSLIPIATGLGHIIGIFLAGSYLIELVFNIDGIGLLSYKSVVNVDYPVFLGFLVINIIILLVGNLLSDMLYVVIDPRIKFE